MTVNVPLLFKGLIEEIDFTDVTETQHINYHFGDEHELKRYLDLYKTGTGEDLADKIMQNGSYDLALSNGLDTQPYPLVWLKKVNRGNPEVKKLDRKGNRQKVTGIELFIIHDTNCEWLNTKRWTIQFSLLNQISELITKKLITSNTTMIIDRYPKIKEYANFKNDADCGVRWDAVVLEFDMIVNNKCFLSKEYAFCN